VLSIGGQANIVETEIGSLVWNANAGTTGTATTANGVGLSYGDNYTIGATGRGSITQNPNHQILNLDTFTGNVNYRFDDGKWRIETGISGSKSVNQRNRGARHFYTFGTTTVVPVRVTFSDIGVDRPGTIQAFDAANQNVDLYNIENYRGTTVTDQPFKNHTQINAGNFNLRRRLNVFPFPTALQLGGSQKVQTLDIRTQNKAWTFNGPDGNPATIESLAPYLAQVYKNQDSHYGFRNIPWLSGSRLWSAWQANPLLVTQTPAQKTAQENFRRTNSEFVQEAVSAWYLQAEVGLFDNRLKVLTGARFESTTDEGKGALSDPNAVFLRNANGSFARDSAGARIRKPDAPAAGSLEELDFILKERASKSNRTYGGYYPSLHLTYNFKENFQVRAAYAKTYGRPNFLDIIPRTVINEFNLDEVQIADPAVVKGSITVRNSRLRPWTSDNFDLSLEYYTRQGGVFSAGVFDKEIKNFFGTAVKVATLEDLAEVGIDDARYVGWNLSTKFNSGDARISGMETNIRQALRELGPWGKHFTVFANATKLRLEGNRQADFGSFIPWSANWGATFERKQITVTARWNYRGRDLRSLQPAFGPDGGEWFKARTSLDLSLGYQFTPRLSLAASINNVLNVPQTRLRYSPATPPYARQGSTSEYGVNVGVGLRGAF
jgi:TonB-dependent receptor